MEKENHEGFTLMIQQDGSKDDLDWCIELYFSKNKDIYLQACIQFFIWMNRQKERKDRNMDGQTDSFTRTRGPILKGFYRVPTQENSALSGRALLCTNPSCALTHLGKMIPVLKD